MRNPARKRSIPTPLLCGQILAGSIAVLLSAGPTAQAATFPPNSWTGSGSSTNWSDNNNWGNGTAPTYGTLTFAAGGTQGTTSINNSITSMNQLLWTGSSSWTLNNSGGTVLSLFDNNNVQAKLENQSSGLVTINAPVTFAATAGAAFAEINAVNGNITFGNGTLTVNGSQVNGIKLFGGGRTTTFNNTVSATGKWFGLTAASTTMAVGGAFTSGDIYVMNGGTLKLNSGGSISTTAIRLGGDFGNTGNQNLASGGTFALTPAAGGLSNSSTINSVINNTSGALLIDSQNTSGTNTLSGGIFMDSDLKTQTATGGTLSFAGGSFDVKIRKLTVGGTGTTSISEVLGSSFAAGGFVVKEGTGTLLLSNTSNTFTGTDSNSLNANGTQINAGTVGISGDGSLGLAPVGAYNNIQFTGNGILQDTATNISLNSKRNISVASGVTATLDSNGNVFTVNGVVNGTGGNLAKAGAGTLLLTGTNTYTGTTTLSAGNLVAGSNVSSGVAGAFGNATSAIVLGDAATTTNNSSPALLSGGAFTIGRAITVGNFATTGKYTIGDNTANSSSFTGNITLSQPVTLTAAAGGVVNFSTGTWTTNNNAITVSGNGTVRLSQPVSSTGGLTVTSGTLQLDAPFTGNLSLASNANLTLGNGTAVSGNLNISGTTNAATVNSGGTLSGTGNFGVVTVNSGGTLSPGNSPGNPTAVSATLNTGSTYLAEIVANGSASTGAISDKNSNRYDRTTLTGAVAGPESVLSLSGNTTLRLSITGTLQVNGKASSSTPYIPTGNNTGFDNYFVFDLTGANDYISGNFTQATLDGSTFAPIDYGVTSRFRGINGIGTFTLGTQEYAISYKGNTATNSTLGGNDLVVTAVPEPGTAVSLLGGLGMLVALQRRRRLRA